MDTTQSQRQLHVALVVGVMAVSLAAVFIRLAGEAPPLTIASYRLTLGAALMVAFAFFSWGRDPDASAHPFPGVAARDIPLLAFSALSLAVHFWTWILSLQHTSVASSVVLVTASPLIVAIASRVFLKESVSKQAALGIGIGLAGGVALAAGDAGKGSELFGDLMAFLGAVSVVGYLLAGRKLRMKMPATTYNTIVYAGTAALLLALAVGTGAQLSGFRTETYLWLAVTAIVPQAIGHSLLNWTLGRVSATTVAIAVMAEPVLATIVAIPVLGELPPWTSVAGGVLILAGIYVAMQRGMARATP